MVQLHDSSEQLVMTCYDDWKYHLLWKELVWVFFLLKLDVNSTENNLTKQNLNQLFASTHLSLFWKTSIVQFEIVQVSRNFSVNGSTIIHFCGRICPLNIHVVSKDGYLWCIVNNWTAVSLIESSSTRLETV